MMTEPPFEGHPDRECGEHRTLGGRAWCHDCTEYCYPGGPCKGCELPQLRAENARQHRHLMVWVTGYAITARAAQARITALEAAAAVLVGALDDAGRLHATTGGPELAALLPTEKR
jgi:hypothetical protein